MMPLVYQFFCYTCGARKRSGPLEISLPDGEMFVHDVGWEYLPKGWVFNADGKMVCDQCRHNKEGNE